MTNLNNLIAASKRITKKDPRLFWILWLILCALDGMQDLLHFVVPDNIFEMESKLIHEDGYTKIRIYPTTIESTNTLTKYPKIKDYLNERLRYDLLPAQNIITPYRVDEYYHDVVEGLYVKSVYTDGIVTWIDVIYVDNPIAYQLVRKDECRNVVI